MKQKKYLIKKIAHASIGRALCYRAADHAGIEHQGGSARVPPFRLEKILFAQLKDYDIKILYSLAEVVHPSLGKIKNRKETLGIISGRRRMVIRSCTATFSKLPQLKLCKMLERSRWRGLTET